MAKSLRQWRTSQLMSIRELATRAGITAKTLTDIEYGRRKPNYETMRTICAVLGVSAHEIQEFVATIESRGAPRRAKAEKAPSDSTTPANAQKPVA